MSAFNSWGFDFFTAATSWNVQWEHLLADIQQGENSHLVMSCLIRLLRKEEWHKEASWVQKIRNIKYDKVNR